MGLWNRMASFVTALIPGRNHKYTALPGSETRGSHDHDPVSSTGEGTITPPTIKNGIWADRNRTVLRISMMGVISTVLIVSLISIYVRASKCIARECDTPEMGYICASSISHSWGQYSPFFSVPSEISASIPSECTLTFASILSRHGARDPTASKSKTYSDLINKMHSSTTSYAPGFEFLKNHSYLLGSDQLTPFGQQEMVNSGIKFYRRYRSLASKEIPFIRSAGQDRVVESGLKWTAGYHAERVRDVPGDALPYPLLSIPEGAGANNTLSHGLCTAFETGPYAAVGDAAAGKWLAVFAPAAAARLNAGLPGANLSLQETVYAMDLCSFETVASPGGGTESPFCGLFSVDEWRDYGYYQSVGKWYGFGPGNPLGATQGVGYVNELIARLTGRAVVDRTSTNSTLDGDEGTFPLGRGLYADFSHDNDMMGVYAALGLYDGRGDLDLDVRREEEADGFRASWAVPFGARMYVEKMVCAGEAEELVRVLVNDRVVRLGGCGADELGRCRLGAFVESLGFARRGGDWDACFA